MLHRRRCALRDAVSRRDARAGARRRVRAARRAGRAARADARMSIRSRTRRSAPGGRRRDGPSRSSPTATACGRSACRYERRTDGARRRSARPCACRGLDVFTIPYGPVRSGVFEAIQFQIETGGEDVPRHPDAAVLQAPRAWSSASPGWRQTSAVHVAERVAGIASVAYAIAFCAGGRARARRRAAAARGALARGPRASSSGWPATWT